MCFLFSDFGAGQSAYSQANQSPLSSALVSAKDDPAMASGEEVSGKAGGKSKRQIVGMVISMVSFVLFLLVTIFCAAAIGAKWYKLK
jgi:hypothetical protein